MMQQALKTKKMYRARYKEAYKAFKDDREEIPLVKVTLNLEDSEAEREVSVSNIEYSVERLKVFLHPSQILWGNILFVKRFRNPEVAANDQVTLHRYYDQFKDYSYSIGEKAKDDLSNKKKKKRTMIYLEEESVEKLNVLREIKAALATLVKSSHIIENLAFLYSPRYGIEQAPHLDYGYDPMNSLDLSSEFFNSKMSYSFVYAIDKGAMMNFTSPDGVKITTHLDPGDLVLWTGQQIHGGARYTENNLRLFGNIRSPEVAATENQFYWVTESEESSNNSEE